MKRDHAKLSQTGTAAERHVLLQFLLGFAGSREAGEERAVEGVSQHEVDGEEDDFSEEKWNRTRRSLRKRPAAVL